MGKHTTVQCWKCGVTVARTSCSPTFGCKLCRPAKGSPEYVKLENLGREKASETATMYWDKRKASGGSPVRDPRPSSPSGSPGFGLSIAAGDEVMERLAVREKITEGMNAVVLQFARPRCSCCSFAQQAKTEAFTEVEDGRLFCVLCAYGVLRTGHCSPHNTTHFQDVADATPRIEASDYPVEVLATQGLRREMYLPTNELPKWMEEA